MNEVLLVLGMALVTFGVRYPVLAFFGRLTLPGVVRRGLQYVPPAVLTALITPPMLMPAGEALELHPGNPYLIAGLTAILVAWWRKNLLLTILTGMLTMWSMRWLISIMGW